MSPSSVPQLIFGAASFGDSFQEPDNVQSVLDLLKTHKITYLDTAGRYPPTNPGRSEELIGLVKAAQQGFTIDTKILAGAGDGSGELTRENIEKSLSTSLERLGLDKVNSSSHHNFLRNIKYEVMLKYTGPRASHSSTRPSNATEGTSCCSRCYV